MSREKSRGAIAWCAVALMAALVFEPGLVRADSSAPAPSADAKRSASVHFRRGVELYQEGAYRAALIELRRAYEIAPDYRVMFNVGQTHYALGEYVEAINALEIYVREGGTEIPQARREEVDTTLTELNKRVAFLRVTTDRDGATILIDGVAVGKTPLQGPVPLSLGRHTVDAETTDGWTANDMIDVAGGDQRTLALAMNAPAAGTVVGPAAPTTLWGKMSIRDRWGYSMLTAGVAVAIGGAIVAGLAKKADSNLSDELNNTTRMGGNRAGIESARDDLKTKSAVADALFGTAALIGITGAVLVLIKEPKKEEEQARRSKFQVGLGYQSIVATGRF
jgi:hypothetical protein